MNVLYREYLKRLYEKANAAWRKRNRVDYQACQICDCHPAQLTEDGGWMCRPHRQEFEAMKPVRSYEERLTKLGVKFMTESEWAKSAKEKRKYKPKPCMVLPVYEGHIMVGVAGTAIPGERARQAAANKKNQPAKSKPLAVIKPMKGLFVPQQAEKPKKVVKSTCIGSVFKKET